jgi:hypothetical protein
VSTAVVTVLFSATDLVAKPENSCKVMNPQSSYVRANNSFVLSHLLRDQENRHQHPVGGLWVDILHASK